MTEHIAAVVEHRDLVGLGEASHQEPAFGRVRNELVAALVGHGFRSFALESDRVAGLVVDDFVRYGIGSLDQVMRDGFSHGFGDLDANRDLVGWLRAYNEGRPEPDRVAFHGIDAPFEFTAESPRRYLEHARDYLGVELDLTDLVGPDDRWGSTEAVTDPARSPGGTAEAATLRAIADDLRTMLYARAPELIAATSRTAWDRARIHLGAALDLLRYHRQAARGTDQSERWSRLGGTRDALMARNLLDIRDAEARRGPTLVYGHNIHLQRTPSRMSMAGMDLTWYGTGAILDALLGTRYAVIVASLDRRTGPAAWRLTAPDADVAVAADGVPAEADAVAGADAVLHITAE